MFVRPLAARAYYLLGDYPAVLHALGDFGPREFDRVAFDMRWGLLPRVRLLRGAAYERMGKPKEAEREYRLAVSQWQAPDPALRPSVEQAELGLARVRGSLAGHRGPKGYELSADKAKEVGCGAPPAVGGRRP